MMTTPFALQYVQYMNINVYCLLFIGKAEDYRKSFSYEWSRQQNGGLMIQYLE